MEKRVASIVTPAGMMLDLGLMHDDMTKYTYEWFHEVFDDTIGKHCGRARQPPPTPESFDAMMDWTRRRRTVPSRCTSPSRATAC